MKRFFSLFLTATTLSLYASFSLAFNLDTFLSAKGFEGQVCIFSPQKKIDLVVGQGHYKNLLGKKKLFNQETLVPIASNSKKFVAALIYKFEELGKLQTEDSIIKYLPELGQSTFSTFAKSWEKVTLDHLIHHRAGIPSYYKSPHWMTHMYKRPISFKQILDTVSDMKFNFSPGSDFSYCNTCYLILGEVLRRASGKSVTSLIKTYYTEQLDLETLFNGLPENLKLKDLIPKSVIPYAYHHIDEVFQDGSMITNCRDHYAGVKALINGKLISNFSIQQNLLNESQTNIPETTYTSGMYKEKNRYYHGGSWIGHHSFFSYNQSNDEFIFLYSQKWSTKKLKKIEEDIRLALNR